MKLIISSKNGVQAELEGQEVLDALFSEEGRFLYELKKRLDKLEAYELSEPTDEEINNIPFFTEEEVNVMLFNEPLTEEKPLSDTEAILPRKESKEAIQIKPKRNYRRKHKHNKKRKHTRSYSVAPEPEKKVTFEGKYKIINDEDDPIIRPAKRPTTSGIEVNV